MKQIIIALAMVLMVATAAWGETVYDNDGYILGGTTKELPVFDAYGNIVGSTGESFVHKNTDSLIIEVLTEALEYIPDGDANYLDTEITCTTLLYTPPHRTLKDDAEDEARAVQAKLDRLRAQTELHHKIKAMIKILKGEE